MAAAQNYNDCHELVGRLRPEQAGELCRHALRPLEGGGGRFRVLRSFDGPAMNLGARAHKLMRAEIGDTDANG